MAEIVVGVGTSHSPLLSIDHAACYRSQAGSGIGAAFAVWR